MNRDYLKQVIADQKQIYLNNELVDRGFDFEENINYCFVGMRRTGKSYMLYQQIQSLQDKGVSFDQIHYVNFEDERLVEVTTQDLDVILEIGIETAQNRKLYIFLDEIQNVENWEKFVRRLADMKYRVSITGSNSKMLSREIASTLGGRYMIVQVFPYSFKEYLHALDMETDCKRILSTAQRAETIRAYDDYVKFGGFPELLNVRNKREYLNSIYQTVYIGDIITRNKVSNDFALRLILKKIAESVMTPISFSRLTNIVNSAGGKVGKQTVINYIGYMAEAYLIFSLQNYAAKLVDKETSPKYYFMDTGLLGILSVDCETAQLENLVAIELVRRYGAENVYFYERSVEIDFYVPEKKLAVQVSYSVLDDNDTKERELSALVKLSEYIPDVQCLVITNSEEAYIEYEGIEISMMPAWKWLLK